MVAQRLALTIVSSPWMLLPFPCIHLQFGGHGIFLGGLRRCMQPAAQLAQGPRFGSIGGQVQGGTNQRLRAEGDTVRGLWHPGIIVRTVNARGRIIMAT